MAAPEIPLLPICLGGGAFAGIAYLVFAKAKRNIIHSLESVMLGIALAGTLHLMYGAVFPEHLVEILDQNDKRLHPPEIKVKLDTIHTLDIVVGGVFLLFLACRGLWVIIRHKEAAGRPNQPSHGGH
jgi:hypothetical protein